LRGPATRRKARKEIENSEPPPLSGAPWWWFTIQAPVIALTVTSFTAFTHFFQTLRAPLQSGLDVISGGGGKLLLAVVL